MITREQALNFLNQKIENKNIIKHMLATEALMGEIYDVLVNKGQTLAEKGLTLNLGGTKEEWMMAGLLHDGDYCQEVAPEKQGVQVTIWLKELGFEISENAAHAMASHNPATGVAPTNLMDWTIFCGDSLTGLIVAATLVLPSKKITDLTIESVLKRFKEKSFARGTRREDILKCEEKLGLKLPEFVQISLSAMQKIHSDLGL